MTERPSTDTGREDTAVRPLTKRVQEKLAAAGKEVGR